MKSLKEYLLDAENIFIMYHVSPDPDAIGSAIALARIMRELGKNVEIFREENMNDQVKRMVSLAGENLVEKPTINPDLLVVVDTSSLSMVNRKTFESIKSKKIAIDHHVRRDDYSGFDYVFVDETSTATAILVYELAKELGVRIDKKTALMLGIGIITDSANFLLGNPRLFSALAELTKIVDYKEIMDVVNMPMNFSERVARLKGATRTELYFVDNYIIATSKTSGFEGSLARALIELGADASFVASSNEHTRLSGRASQRLVKLGLNLGKDILPKIAEEFGGDAGGHAGAAGANGFDKSLVDQVLERCVDLVTTFLKSRSGSETS